MMKIRDKKSISSKINFHILTIFPDCFAGYFGASILKRAQEKKLVNIKIYDIRKFTADKRKTADDSPFGGGAGMVMKAEPIIMAVDNILKKIKGGKVAVVVLSAKGKMFNQNTAYSYSKKFTDIILICGRYEGIDERVKKALNAREISIGPYVLTDGDVAAMNVVSAVARLVPGVIKTESLKEESFWNLALEREKKGNLEYPHYTRPEVFEFKGKKYRVPKVLLSGNHQKINEWRKTRSKKN